MRKREGRELFILISAVLLHTEIDTLTEKENRMLLYYITWQVIYSMLKNSQLFNSGACKTPITLLANSIRLNNNIEMFLEHRHVTSNSAHLIENYKNISTFHIDISIK